MEFYKHDQLFLLLCYLIRRRDLQESIVYQSSEIYYFRNKPLSQIRISVSKREKECAVCPYLLFTFERH